MSQIPPLSIPPVTFVTVRRGREHSVDYVNILFDMIKRNLPPDLPRRLVCFTDDPSGIEAGIEIRGVTEGSTGGYDKLALFKDGVFEKGVRIVFIDLNTVLIGPLVDFLAYDGNFALLRNTDRPGAWSTDFMMWKSGYGRFIWDKFVEAGKPRVAGGEAAWIASCKPEVDFLQTLFPGFFVNYKMSSQLAPPQGAHVICFKGDQKLHEIQDGWVRQAWVKGGHFRQAFGTLGDALAHVRHTLTLPFPQVRQMSQPEPERAICLVGSGASRVRYLDHLHQAKQKNYEIWALDDAFGWLVEQGFSPDVHILASSDMGIAEYVPEHTEAVLLYASQCHPEVFLRASAASARVVAWHQKIEGIDALPDFGQSVLIDGGSTTEILAVNLAFTIGGRTLHLFGYDSSYEVDEALEGESVVDNSGAERDQKIYVQVDDRRFVSSLSLAGQVNQFRDLLKTLVPQGLGITMHGEGLLPYAMQKLMVKPKAS